MVQGLYDEHVAQKDRTGNPVVELIKQRKKEEV